MEWLYVRARAAADSYDPDHALAASSPGWTMLAAFAQAGVLAVVGYFPGIADQTQLVTWSRRSTPASSMARLFS